MRILIYRSGKVGYYKSYEYAKRILSKMKKITAFKAFSNKDHDYYEVIDNSKNYYNLILFDEDSNQYWFDTNCGYKGMGSVYSEKILRLVGIREDYNIAFEKEIYKFNLCPINQLNLLIVEIDLLNDIENGLLDFGVFIREYDKKYYEGIRLNLQNELGLWVSKDHFLADKNVIEATNLKDISLVVAHQAINDGEVPSFISDDQIIGTYDLIENARVIVKHNLASALVINKEDYDTDLKFIHIKNMPQYHWYMIWKKESKTKIQEKFIDYLKQYYE